MPDQPTARDGARILYELQHNDALRQQAVAEAALDPELAMLRTWQSQRLAQTYADILIDPHAGPACRFFLSDIYAPRDFSQRDHDVERIYAFLSRLMPAQTLQLLTDIIALNHLTNELDTDLCRVLAEQPGVTDAITPQRYAEAYRACANYQARVQQIDCITTVLTQVGAGARLGVVGLAMKLVRRPAQRAGWSELYDFLARGYAAFRQLQDVPTFVGTIAHRERRILDQLYSGNPAPFTI